MIAFVEANQIEQAVAANGAARHPLRLFTRSPKYEIAARRSGRRRCVDQPATPKAHRARCTKENRGKYIPDLPGHLTEGFHTLALKKTWRVFVASLGSGERFAVAQRTAYRRNGLGERSANARPHADSHPAAAGDCAGGFAAHVRAGQSAGKPSFDSRSMTSRHSPSRRFRSKSADLFLRSIVSWPASLVYSKRSGGLSAMPRTNCARL